MKTNIKKAIFLLFLISLPFPLYAKCIKGNCKNGYGVWVKYADVEKKLLDQKYEGHWKNGKFSGKGKLSYYQPFSGILSRVLEGNFRAGQLHGHGKIKFYFKSRLSYVFEGSFRYGVKHGFFVNKNYSDGSYPIGELRVYYKNGKKANSRTYIFYRSNGTVRHIEKGIFETDEWEFKGTVTYYNENGKKTKVEKFAIRKKATSKKK